VGLASGGGARGSQPASQAPYPLRASCARIPSRSITTLPPVPPPPAPAAADPSVRAPTAPPSRRGPDPPVNREQKGDDGLPRRHHVRTGTITIRGS